jgi:hypothetical protein
LSHFLLLLKTFKQKRLWQTFVVFLKKT